MIVGLVLISALAALCAAAVVLMSGGSVLLAVAAYAGGGAVAICVGAVMSVLIGYLRSRLPRDASVGEFSRTR